MAFGEDDGRIRKGDAPQNFGMLRPMAVHRPRQEKTDKLGVKNKRGRAGWDDAYLGQVRFGEN